MNEKFKAEEERREPTVESPERKMSPEEVSEMLLEIETILTGFNKELQEKNGQLTVLRDAENLDDNAINILSLDIQALEEAIREHETILTDFTKGKQEGREFHIKNRE